MKLNCFPETDSLFIGLSPGAGRLQLAWTSFRAANSAPTPTTIMPPRRTVMACVALSASRRPRRASSYDRARVIQT